ncbi:hypothetical protein [Kriegella aquimaris]|nr:hypothetical protein [Kriegella aquimaris]
MKKSNYNRSSTTGQGIAKHYKETDHYGLNFGLRRAHSEISEPVNS